MTLLEKWESDNRKAKHAIAELHANAYKSGLQALYEKGSCAYLHADDTCLHCPIWHVLSQERGEKLRKSDCSRLTLEQKRAILDRDVSE